MRCHPHPAAVPRTLLENKFLLPSTNSFCYENELAFLSRGLRRDGWTESRTMPSPPGRRDHGLGRRPAGP